MERERKFRDKLRSVRVETSREDVLSEPEDCGVCESMTWLL